MYCKNYVYVYVNKNSKWTNVITFSRHVSLSGVKRSCGDNKTLK